MNEIPTRTSERVALAATVGVAVLAVVGFFVMLHRDQKLCIDTPAKTPQHAEKPAN